MITKNIVQSSVNVIRITNLKKGDIYKRYDDSYSTSVQYGIIKDINNNGEKTFIEAVEYKKSYGSMSAEIKIFGSKDDIAIFPTTLDELTSEFSSLVERLEADIKEKKEEINKKLKCIEDTKMLISGEMSKMLGSVEYKELTQSEFNQLKIQKEAEMSL